MKPKKGDFWVFNISNTKDIYLSDLRIKISKNKYLNLLSGNNNFTEAQLEESLKNGSIAAKIQYLKISRVKPIFNNPKQEPLPVEIRLVKNRSSINEEDDILPELQLLDSLLPDEDEEDITERNNK